MVNPDLTKSEIRRKILTQRNSISTNTIIMHSKSINNKIIAIEEYENSKSLGVYYPIGSEVQTFDLIRNSLNHNKMVCLPKIIDSRTIEFFKIIEDSFEKISFQKGKYGIFEPSISTETIEKIDMLIIPGIAFDLKGNRIGYGKGYYDRYLSSRKAKYKIGLAYEIQVLNNIPNNELDIPIDIIVTEKRIIRI
ncbi:MAG TPA: 5-formyltetrahydrofolate cyclo-ligase [Nitrososphaeraceae archaeon]|nr:5-formyltetrahydrofolate cyclo-ligase [Nitrososphaeraceae archaeon]